MNNLTSLADEYAALALFAREALPAYEDCGNILAARSARIRYAACAAEYRNLTGNELGEIYPTPPPAPPTPPEGHHDH